jgi:hypothetical protein
MKSKILALSKNEEFKSLLKQKKSQINTSQFFLENWLIKMKKNLILVL